VIVRSYGRKYVVDLADVVVAVAGKQLVKQEFFSTQKWKDYPYFDQLPSV
jgi:hypothetical protein